MDSDIVFKSSLFGGFNRDEVLDYIDSLNLKLAKLEHERNNSAAAHSAELFELNTKYNAATERVNELEHEKTGLINRIKALENEIKPAAETSLADTVFAQEAVISAVSADFSQLNTVTQVPKKNGFTVELSAADKPDVIEDINGMQIDAEQVLNRTVPDISEEPVQAEILHISAASEKLTDSSSVKSAAEILAGAKAISTESVFETVPVEAGIAEAVPAAAEVSMEAMAEITPISGKAPEVSKLPSIEDISDDDIDALVKSFANIPLRGLKVD